MFNRGDTVQIVKDAAFVDGRLVPSVYLGEKLVVKSVEANGYILGRGVKMPSIGIAVNKDHIMAYEEIFAAEIEPYYISMVKDTNIFATPANDARIIRTVPKMSLFKIVNEKSGWGKLEVGSGWVNLADVMRI